MPAARPSLSGVGAGTQRRPIVEASAVTKSYGAVRALRHVDLSVYPGEILALAGENGSGKSTMARILAGSLTPDGGGLAIDGQPVSFRRPRDALGRGIAVVTQEITSVPELSIGENVLLSRMANPATLVSRRAIAREAAPLLARVGIGADPGARFSSLRMGDRERVEVARALAAQPRLIILDEATSRLGETDVARLFRLLRELRSEGVSSIIITHRLSEMTELADRAVVLRDGSLVGELTGAELTQDRLATLMVGRPMSDLFPPRRPTGHDDVVLAVEDLVVAGTATPISFRVGRGRVVGLSGLVGSGRTEVLETLAGLRPYQRGRISVNGAVVAPGSVRRAMDAGIHLVPEDRHQQGLVMAGSVQRNIAMGSWRIWRSASGRRDEAQARAAVERLRIKIPTLDAPVTALSGGNQQRVVLARVLAAAPRVLLLDEPARGIDIAAKAEIFQLIDDVVAHGMAVLMASSDMMETLGMADNVIVLHEGRIVAEVPGAEATQERLALLAGGGRSPGE